MNLRNIRFLMITSFAISLATAMNGALYNNFLKVMLSGDYIKIGQVEAVRETPGILSAFINGMLIHLPEPILAGVSLFVLAVGFAGYYWTTNIGMLMGMSFLSSIGLHLWMPLSNSMGMHLAPEGRKGEVLGKIAGVAGIGTLMGYLTIAVMGHFMAAQMKDFYRYMYFVAGFITLIGAMFIWRIYYPPTDKIKPRLVWKKKYYLYYFLQLLEGCRKQVFITFATFTLVLTYQTGPQVLAVLLFINYIFATIAAPIFGKWIDKYGEKKILTVNYSILILIYIGYALIHQWVVLAFLFCVDNIIFTLSMALTTYLGKIADKEDMTGTLAMGVSVNHISAVIVPIVGFMIWKNYGYEICFVGGAIVVLIQLIAAQRIKIDAPTTTT